jgi:hypothetical protein
VDAIPQCRPPVPRLTCHKETRPPWYHSYLLERRCQSLG